MRILAWIMLAMVTFNVAAEPFMYGKPRGNYGTVTWIGSILGAGIFVPLCGRVLGWW